MKKSTFIEGAFFATFCIILTKVLGVLYVIPFYKIIGEQGGTLYGYAYNIYNVFLIISTAGIPLAISKLTSEYNTLKMYDKKNRMFQIATSFIMCFSFISFLICFIFAPNLANMILGELQGGNTIDDVSFVIRVISFSLLVIPFLSIERGYLQGHTYIREPSISQVIEQIVRIVIIIIGSYTCTKILKLPIKYSVGVSVFAACIGGFITFLYLTRTINKNKKQLGLQKKIKAKTKYDKEIIQKIFLYSLPFIIINLANTLYTSTDMILVIRTLPKLGYSATDTEFISSVFTTWGVKFNTIITSISTGLIISLIPNIVKSFTEKNYKEVNINFNKCLKIVILIIAPLAVFLSGMSDNLWNIFYGANIYGQKIIKYTIIVTIFDCLYMVINSLLQSLNKSKIIYISVIIGLLCNLLLDVPLMHLFSNIGLPAYYGAITATLFGFIISNTMSIIYLNKNMDLEYKETVNILPKSILSLFLINIVTKICNVLLPNAYQNRILSIINIFISGLLVLIIFLTINKKELKEILPEKITNKLVKIKILKK